MLSVALMHLAKAVRRNEMPFGRDSRVVSGNIVLDKGPTERADLVAGTTSSQPTAKLLLPLFLSFSFIAHQHKAFMVENCR